MRQYHHLTVALVLSFLLSATNVKGEERRIIAQEKLDCLIEASATLKIGAPVPGLIREVLVERGDVVRQG
ncbi:MAG: hypothetical protein QOH14_4087, partial [Pseudonocardiales bacterium]|nr:hypothetical protein [Pseudonocardiales bacterium]